MTPRAKQDRKKGPVRLEVIAPTFQGLGICPACELVMTNAGLGERPTERGLDEYPEEWQADWSQLVEWVDELAQCYGDGVFIKVIDPQSLEGFFKSVRHRVRRYPTWIVDGRTRVVGWDRGALDALLQRP